MRVIPLESRQGYQFTFNGRVHEFGLRLFMRYEDEISGSISRAAFWPRARASSGAKP
jgi:hypothetical protein